MGTTFLGVNTGGFGGYSLTDQILYNLKWFIEWGMLNAGAYTITQLDNAESELKAVDDERYLQGQVWNGAGGGWVWESGISVDGYTDPFRVAGVYINNTFYPVGTLGSHRFHVDYQHGRIIFNKPHNPASIIQAEYCWKNVHIDFGDCPEFRKLMQDAINRFLNDSEPTTDPVKDHQIWLPAIFLQERSGTSRGLELGGGQIKSRIISAHIFAETPWVRNLLMDILDNQNRMTFYMADLNTLTFPFDEYGDIVDGATNWPTMATSHRWKKLRSAGGTANKLQSVNPQIFRGQVDWEIEIDYGGI